MTGANRQVIIRAFDRGSGTHFTRFLKGNKAYDLVSENHGPPELRVTELEEDAKLRDMAIGQDLGNGLELLQVQVKAPFEKVQYPDFSSHRIEHYETAEEDGTTHKHIRHAHHEKHEKTHKVRGEDPFEELEALIGDIEGGATGDSDSAVQTPPNLELVPDDIEQPTPLMPHDAHEAAQQPVNIEEQIKQLSERFEDKTYVPSIAEYQAMQDVASRIRIDYGDENGKKPIHYLTDSGGQLNATETRAFLDNASRGKWSMKDREAEVVEDLAQHATPINIKRLDLSQRTSKDILSFKQFGEEEALSRHPAVAAPDDKELLEDYKYYLNRRLELSDMLTNRQNIEEEYAHYPGDIRTPEDVVIDAMKDFSSQQRRERVRNRPASIVGRATRRAAARLRRRNS